MGSVIYDFLNDSFLFDETHQGKNYSSISESELRTELENYRDFALGNVSLVHEEIKCDSYQLKIFGAKEYFSVERLMQTAFYLDQIILPDPIFPFSHSESDISKTISQYLGMSKKDTIDRKSLAIEAKKMKILAPMVAANYLKFFPVSYYLGPTDQIPLTYSECGFSDVLSPSILSMYRKNAEVKSLKKSDIGFIVEEALNIGRAIAIYFKDDDDKNIFMYNLFEQEVVKIDEETRILHFAMTLPEEPPTVDYFQAWVNQSINQAARAHYEQVYKSFMLSCSFGASFLTSSKFTHSILGTSASNENVRNYSSDCILNLDLPFLSNIKMADLMNVRQNDGEAFDLFRRELESKFRELRMETDPEVIKVKIQNIVHELGEVQLAKIDQKIKGLKRGALAQTIIAVAGLAGTVVTSGWSLAATVLALANGFRSYNEYREKVKENPTYFLWKVKNA